MKPLSPTELTVLVLRDQGNANKQVASELRISINTVRTHCDRILRKTGARCIPQAAFLLGGSRVYR